MTTAPEGPYMNEDGDWWVPVEGISFKKARTLIVDCLYGECRLAYLGKEMTWLDSEHEDNCSRKCPHNRHILAYHFEERRDN